ncbi:hypothetical protein [Candidatus Ichthyocystis hellenicum]|uniref:hypothetical protein n=1 Tax=Candidatus Ichthyocystis hellenicum TaxID=1561003 RepID=UPI000B830C0D|nr:hypothetical protein [Candidatus Ichthyocystis hellenicum]
MVNGDVSLRRSSVSTSGGSAATSSISLPSSRVILQEVLRLPPPYEAGVPQPPPYSAEPSPPSNRLSLDSEYPPTVGGGIARLGLEVAAGSARDRYLLMFTYPFTNPRLLFSSRCVGSSFFFKYFVFLGVCVLLGIICGISVPDSETEEISVALVIGATIDGLSSILAFFLLGVVVGYCCKVRSVEREG